MKDILSIRCTGMALIFYINVAPNLFEEAPDDAISQKALNAILDLYK